MLHSQGLILENSATSGVVPRSLTRAYSRSCLRSLIPFFSCLSYSFLNFAGFVLWVKKVFLSFSIVMVLLGSFRDKFT